MPGRSRQKKPTRSLRKGTAKPRRTRRDIPNKASIVATETFTSPKGKQYTILQTNQMDPYDVPNESRRKRR